MSRKTEARFLLFIVACTNILITFRLTKPKDTPPSRMLGPTKTGVLDEEMSETSSTSDSSGTKGDPHEIMLLKKETEELYEQMNRRLDDLVDRLHNRGEPLEREEYNGPHGLISVDYWHD
ncbi:hypothetical protein CPB83DRAFT_840690 [Crepidotus variabilis]|uniref:Uncharacterized protein n=1 Tax=Crepidotus variabilis TaxID=179855 RepID=A0A9P6E434_9AGAR|nr:hypothetical protein CPB83DRAFT_840690 [Crepidotus variabilis]